MKSLIVAMLLSFSLSTIAADVEVKKAQNEEAEAKAEVKEKSEKKVADKVEIKEKKKAKKKKRSKRNCGGTTGSRLRRC